MSINSHQKLPASLYRVAQVRELDRICIEEEGIPGITLMERAGRAAFEEIKRRWPDKKELGVVCGGGNNGGDGFIVARLAHEAGYKVTVWQTVCLLAGDALTAQNRVKKPGVEMVFFDHFQDLQHGILVDALLGTGLSGEITGQRKEAINSINAAHQKGAAVISLDIPSGLHAETGAVLGCAVEADCTISFIGLKQGMFTGDGPDYCGDIILDDLAVPDRVYSRVQSSAKLLDTPDVAAVLPPRRLSSHKGHYGHVLVVGGDNGMMGAARLASEAAARTGAGLVSLATRKEHAATICSAVPEIMSHGVDDIKSAARLLRVANVIAIGPGLGQDSWSQSMFNNFKHCHLPTVVDADALNLLAVNPMKRDNWILTPHPGEASRLLGVSIAEIQSDRFAAAKELQKQYGGVLVLKGAGSIVLDSNGEFTVCSAGNPGMASGGMGDLLTGIIAGLLAQGASIDNAAKLGVCLHARAGDLAAHYGQRGMLASDLLPELRGLMG